MVTESELIVISDRNYSAEQRKVVLKYIEKYGDDYCSDEIYDLIMDCEDQNSSVFNQ